MLCSNGGDRRDGQRSHSARSIAIVELIILIVSTTYFILDLIRNFPCDKVKIIITFSIIILVAIGVLLVAFGFFD
jgi:hypothetical protein